MCDTNTIESNREFKRIMGVDDIAIPVLSATVDGELLNEDKLRELSEYIEIHRMLVCKVEE